MTTALIVSGNFTDASTTLSTAQKLYTDTSGSTTNTKTSLIGTATGYGEVFSQGNASAWAAAGGTSAPTGHGWLFDVTTLENQTIIAGNWSAIVRMAVSTGTCTADIIMRAYKRSSGGVYTLIASMTLAGQAFTTTTTTYTFGNTAGNAISFVTGDKLYQDCWANVTVAGATGATLKYATSVTSATGKLQNGEVITPGYVPSASAILYGPHRRTGRIQ